MCVCVCLCGISFSNTRVCLRGGFLLIFIDSLPLSTDSWLDLCDWHFLSNTFVCLRGGFFLANIVCLPLSTNGWYKLYECGISLTNTLVCLEGGFLLTNIFFFPLVPIVGLRPVCLAYPCQIHLFV